MSKLLPTPDDLRTLPPRAVIAFAARCCRRIQPLYDLPHNQPHPAMLDEPIRAAESFARAGGPASTTDAARMAMALTHVANAAHHAGHAWSCMEPWEHHHRNDPSANAAAAYAENEAHDLRLHAADEAIEAGRTVGAADALGDVATLATQVARTATHVTASHVAAKARPGVAADFIKLRELCVQFADSPIDPSEDGPLGPLWPLGEPSWVGVKD